MSNKRTLDKIFDDLVDEAASIVTERLGRNIPEPETIEFSKEHENAMRKIFRKERNKLLYKHISKYSKRVAVFFLVVIVASSIMVYSVEAWRIKVMNFVIEVSQTHSEINFREDSTKGDSYTSDEITLGYMPEGSKLEKSDVRKNYISLVFKGEENYFIFSMNSIDSSMGIDTENASVKKITIKGQEAFYSSNANVNILVWYNEEFSYTLSGTINEKEMIKIAENIKE
jgi:hypothetical protein